MMGWVSHAFAFIAALFSAQARVASGCAMGVPASSLFDAEDLPYGALLRRWVIPLYSSFSCSSPIHNTPISYPLSHNLSGYRTW